MRLRRGIAVLFASLIAAHAAPGQAEFLFKSAFHSFDVGASQAFIGGQSTPTAVAVGDLNADGLRDLVVACPGGPAGPFTGSTVSVLLRRANTDTPPLFSEKMNFATGAGPVAVALGDMNGDLKVDVVTANYTGNTVSVLFGDGTGRLSAPTSYAVGTNPRGVAIGELNGDGALDVVVANAGSNSISVLLNGGAGVLAAAVSYATQVEPRAVVIANFNANAALDVVACNYGTGTMSFFANNGAGALNSAVNIPVATKPTAMAVGTLDAGTTNDVAVACSSKVVLRLGNGSGGFAGGSITTAVDPLAIAVKNFTGDPSQDIAIAGSAPAGAPNVAVLPGLGTGTFGSAVYYDAGPTPWGIAVAPIVYNNEAVSGNDIIVANTGDVSSAAAMTSHTVSVLRWNGTGFGAGLELAAGTQANRVAAGDLDRDGIPDLVVGGVGTNGLMVALGLGDGTFGSPGDVAIGGGDVGRVWAVDLNRDGILDILFERRETAEMYSALGIGSGAFAAPVMVASGYAAPCAVGDVNRDGILDFLATTGATAQVFLGTGAGTFAAGFGCTAPLPATALRSLTLGDWNRDARLDLVVTTESGVYRWLGVGDGSFTGPSAFLASHATDAGAVADVNRDGCPDLALADEGIAPITGDEKQGVAVLLGDCLGGFGAPVLYPALDLPRSLEIADVNRDGKPDLLAKNGSTTQSTPPTLSVLLGGGGGGSHSFGARTDYAAGENPLGIALADFDRDGKLDVAGTGLGRSGATPQGIVSILRGNAPYAFGALNARTDYGHVSIATAGAASGDTDRDGKEDVALVGTIAGVPYLAVLWGNGAGAFYGGGVNPLGGLDPRSVALADLDRDGILDVIIGNANSTNVYVITGNIMSSFPQARPTNEPPFLVAVGDLNRDGKIDLVTGNPGASTLSILLGGGDGTFSAPASLSTVNGVMGIGIADLNRDGLPDIVTTGGGTGITRVHLQLSDGSFVGNGNVTIGPNPMSPVFGDFNRDGILDVAVGSTGGGGRVSILFANASGQLGVPNEYGVPGFPTQLSVADMNADGALDIVVSMPGTVSVLTGVGGPGGGFNPAVNYPAPTAQGVSILDLNQDGRPDVVTGNSTEQNVSVFLNGGTVYTGVAAGGAPAAKAALLQNAPNPFNPRTVIRFALPRAGRARLTIHDAAGRRVATLIDGIAAAGPQRVEWSGRDDAGRAVASGIYFYKLEADGVALSRRMALLK